MQKFFLACVSVFALIASPSVRALTVEEAWKPPQISGVSLSPNGKFFAATAPIKGRMNLVVIDLDTRKAAAVTSLEDFDVLQPQWVGNERLVFTLGQQNSPTGPSQFDGGGLFVVNRDGSGGRTLSPTLREARARNQYVYRGLSFFRTIPGNTDEIIASGNLSDAQSVDLYKLDLRTGRSTLLTQGRPSERTSSWIVDSKLVPRIVTAQSKDKPEVTVFYRSGIDAAWQEIARFDVTKGPAFVPLAFEVDDLTLQVASNRGRDTMAIHRYDPDKKLLGEVIAAHPQFDVGADASGQRAAGVILEPVSGKILGYEVNAARPEVTWIDENYVRIQTLLDGTLKGTVNRFRRTPDGSQFLVTAISDINSTRWYLFNEPKKTLEELAVAKPWLDGKQVEQRPFVYTSRDGLKFPGYYFLPKDYKAGTRLPTVVHIHGGPQVRADYWGSGFGVLEGQLLASRGYAVVVPNFRVTPGIGSKAYYAGFGSIGRQMSDDHEDALKWAVEQGFADAKRSCISGASYGGYAALQSMIRNPGTFKCAVAGLAVTDLEFQHTSTETDYASSDSALNFWKAMIGTDSFRSALTRDISPVNKADQIKAPVFLYAGRDDSRVPIDQINRMAKELERVGNPAKRYLIKEKEGHGFGKLENNVDTWTRIIEFLDSNLKP